MEKRPASPPNPGRHRARRMVQALRRNARGGVLIEAAILLPILIMLLVGMVNYGLWFMAAHAIQQAANEGARAALAGIDDSERLSLASDTVKQSVAAVGVVKPALVSTTSAASGNFYTVTVTYNIAKNQFFATSLLPMPVGPIRRASVVKLSSL